ncbi:transporter substrate-binding domain-containing protein [Lactobacillus gasseri]|nr:transporter substrate-binding domain-containing protein [Lactobacillus gasseri]
MSNFCGSLQKFSVGINKKDQILKNKINQALDHLEKTGELEKIKQKWFN